MRAIRQLIVGLAVTTCLLVPMDGARGQQVPQPKVPPPTATLQSILPSGTLKLRDLGKGRGETHQIWIEEQGTVRNGNQLDLWVLQVLPPNDVARGSSRAAAWTFIRFDCAIGTAAVRRSIWVNAKGGPLDDDGSASVSPVPPRAGSGIDKAMQTGCTLAGGDASIASSARQAIQWTRNPALALAQRPIASRPRPIPLPNDPLALKDLLLEHDQADFFVKYYWTPGELMASNSQNIWVLSVAQNDWRATLGAQTIVASARWTNWVAGCNSKELNVRYSALVASDGQLFRLPGSAVALPRPMTLESRQGLIVTMPPEHEAEAIFNKLCPDRSPEVAIGSTNFSLEPLIHATTRAAITAARRGRMLKPRERVRAVSCIALTRGISLRAQDFATNEWKFAQITSPMHDLERLLREALRSPAFASEAALSAAAVRWTQLFDRSSTNKDSTFVRRELDQCIADVPLGLQPGQFSLR